jgi:hypothetical protein
MLSPSRKHSSQHKKRTLDDDDGPTVTGSTSSRPNRFRAPGKLEDNPSSDDTVSCPLCTNAIPIKPTVSLRL